MKERDYTLDLIKTTAMLGVIALHSMMYYITPGHTGLADILYDLGMTSMPLFFMVSGYLMIPRES
ncbi:MAG: acyltransferase family protein [Prevotella sp.]|nr:acyltransferase family protein [Prevotella sp.]